ncbi:hypothetical protein KP509_19G007500 [Ceratopteris richardii]|nr:hypothetical protein KP509_19G007500 [Ceratopteris richardii]
MDAMKRTISGMLGLLPSDQFHVTVETSQEPLEKLFVSSMMTGYTLRNAEYRLCLQKSLEFSGDNQLGEGGMSLLDFQGGQEEVNPMLGTSSGKEKDNFVMDVTSSESCFQDHHSLMEDWKEHSENFASISDDARHYIQHLKQKLASVAKELEEYKQMNSGLQVQGLVGEEKNDLLDYLRSLPPEKVAELSQPTSSEVEEVIQKVINGLLDNPITELHYKSGQFANRRFNSLNIRWKDEVDKELSSSPVQSQSAILVNRDHLARLLFWCMLLGHYMRGLEYRLELSRTLSLCEDLDTEIPTEIE